MKATRLSTRFQQGGCTSRTAFALRPFAGAAFPSRLPFRRGLACSTSAGSTSTSRPSSST